MTHNHILDTQLLHFEPVLEKLAVGVRRRLASALRPKTVLCILVFLILDTQLLHFEPVLEKLTVGVRRRLASALRPITVLCILVFLI